MKRGISLVALVITIIVLIILTTTIMMMFNDGGILGKTEEAVFKSDFSNVLDSFMLYKNELMLENLGNVNVTTENEDEIKANIPILQNNNKKIDKYSYVSLIQIHEGKLYQSNYIANANDKKDKEISRWLEEVGIGKKDIDVPEELLEYVLGEDKNGRRMSEIINDRTFKDEQDTIPNASEKVNYMITMKESGSTMFYYVKYNNVAYRITTTSSEYSTSPNKQTTTAITKVYEKTLDKNNWEGEIVKFDAKEEGIKTDWLVLYDNGDTVDIMSINVMGSLMLGKRDTKAVGSTDLEKAIYSYNNVVDRLNDYCESLIKNTDAIAVRSVGSNPNFNIADTTSKYTSTNLQSWYSGTYNNVGKVGDINAEQDIVRMSYFSPGLSYETYGYACSNDNYWLASRLVFENSDLIDFCVKAVYSGYAEGYVLWRVRDNDLYSGAPSYPVRPIVRVEKSKLSLNQ